MKWDRSQASKEDVITELKKLAEKLDKTPTWLDCVNCGDIPMSRLKNLFGGFNDALIAAGLPVNRQKSKRSRNPKQPNYHVKKSRGPEPIFTNRFCNVCDREFQARDDMRSCRVCTHTKNADGRGGLSDTRYGIGYLT